MKRYSIVLFLLSIVILSCGRFNNNKKESNGKVRLVSVSKQLTEFLFALQQGDKVVGVDLSSTYPPEATKLPTVGYHRLLSTEGIISLEPTLVVHQGDVAPPSVMPWNGTASMTTTFVAALGPLLVTVMTYENASPLFTDAGPDI